MDTTWTTQLEPISPGTNLKPEGADVEAGLARSSTESTILNTPSPKLENSQHGDNGDSEKHNFDEVLTFKPDDPDNPLNMSLRRKWAIVIIVSSASLCVTCCSSMVASTYTGLRATFGVSQEVATLGLTLFIAGLGIGPLLLSPLSELYGRNIVYRCSYTLFLLFNIPVAVGKNFTTFAVGRFLSGVSGSAFLSVAGGTVSDMFGKQAIAGPMAIYTASPFLGPVLDKHHPFIPSLPKLTSFLIARPIIAGFINQHVSWRWTWYVQLMWTGAELAMIVAFVPETYPRVLLKQKAARLRRETGDESIRAAADLEQRSLVNEILQSCKTPFQILFLEPMAALLCLWTAFLLGTLYAFFSAFGIVFGGKGFELQYVGLSFIGMGLGIVAATCTYPLFNRQYAATAARLGRQPPPEAHLIKGMYGAVIVPISLFWFAWTSQPHVHWSATILASIPFGFGTVLVFQSVFTFLVDSLRPVAASALGANSFARSAFGAAFPLFTTQMYQKLGVEWATTLLAFVALALAPLPFVFYRYGAYLRRNSRFSDSTP